MVRIKEKWKPEDRAKQNEIELIQRGRGTAALDVAADALVADRVYQAEPNSQQ